MRRLRIVVLTPDAERFRGALTSAAAQAALGGEVAILLQQDAVALLARGVDAAPSDARHAAAGLPTLPALLDEALGLGVAVTACQSGLTLTGITADTLDRRIEIGGPVSFLQEMTDADRLLLV